MGLCNFHKIAFGVVAKRRQMATMYEPAACQFAKLVANSRRIDM